MSRSPRTVRTGNGSSASRVGTSSPMAPWGMWSTSSTSGSKLNAVARMVSRRMANTSENGDDSDTGDQLPGPALRMEGSSR